MLENAVYRYRSTADGIKDGVRYVKLLIVDDERLALSHLERTIKAAAEELPADFEIMTFQFAEEAIKHAGAIQPDVVFLDIHMPKLTGLQAAELIVEQSPDTDIVFVTAYDEYAVQAFELNALDYVLKPFTSQRLAKTLGRIVTRRAGAVHRSDAARNGTASHPQKIYCFKTLRFQMNGDFPEIPKWRTAKAQELFAYLLHRRGEVVHKSAIMELLMPELDQKRATTQLYTVIYQIRQCLRQMGMNITISNASIQEGYMLHLGDAVVDCEEWERKLEALKGDIASNAGELGKLLEQYEGDYLEDHDYLWAEFERERLRQLWLQHARQLTAYLLEKGDPRQALGIVERLQAMDPYHEEEALRLLMLYDRIGQYDKVFAHYDKIDQIFRQELGLSVPAAVEDWFNGWKASRFPNHDPE